MGEERALVAGCLLASFEGPVAPAWLRRWADDGLAGVVLFAVGGNVGDGEQVAALARSLRERNPDLYVSLDEEGGDVTRLEAATGSAWPGNAALGAVDDVAITRRVAAAMGMQMAEVGIDLDLAPSVDVNSNPANPVIGVRSFGADPALVARHGVAFVEGLQSAGVAACAKHFPGHGDTCLDSHHAVPVVDADAATMASRELAPFRAVRDAGVAAVMTSHVVAPAFDAHRPATISRRLLVDLLRDEIGFDGAVVTDALDMAGISAERGIPAAAVSALAAGADLLCLGARQDEGVLLAVESAVLDALRAGILSEDRLLDAHQRVAQIRRPRSAGVRVPDASFGLDAARRALRVEGTLPPLPLAAAHVVTCRPPEGMAVGPVPWGIAAAWHDLDPAVTAMDVRCADDPLTALVASGRPLVGVVRDAHRLPWQRDALEVWATARPDLVVVEMGWPGPERLPGVATIFTYGASRASSEAVARLLATQDGRAHG